MYEVALRLLPGEGCGAPFRGLPEGGVFSCEFCHARLVLEARPTEVASTGMLESERLELLSKQVDQDHSRGVVGFEHLVHDGLHDPARVKEGIAEWNRARAD